MASNPLAAASRKRPTPPSIVSTQSAQSARAPSEYSYSSSASSSSGSVDPGKKSAISLHNNGFIAQQQGGAQMVDITGTLDGTQQQHQASVLQKLQLQLLMFPALVQQHHQQQQQTQQQPQQNATLFALFNSFATGNGLSGVASPFVVGTSPGVPPPHPPPYNQSATPPMLQKPSIEKCNGAGGAVTVPMPNNNQNIANANQQNILRSCPLPVTTTALANNIAGQNTTGQLLASFGIPYYEKYELYSRLCDALQNSSAAAVPQNWLAACHLSPQLQPNSANGVKQSPQSNQQLLQLHNQKGNGPSPTAESKFSNGIGSTNNNESPLLEKISNASKRRSTCQAQGSAFTPLANSPTNKSPANRNSSASLKTLRGDGPKKVEGIEEGKKKREGTTEMREVTSGARRPVPRKTRRLSVECGVDVPSSYMGRAIANSSSPKGQSPGAMVPSSSLALARSKTDSQQSFGSGSSDIIMPSTFDQNGSPSSSQSSESPTGTNASPMEQDDEMMPTDDNFQCLWEQCGEMFTKEKPFVDHVNEHVRAEQSPSFFCRWNTCKRREPFNAQYMLAQHVRKHSGEKPYQCEFVFPDGTRCKKSYSRLENKKTHERTHNGERPYQCAVCNKSFTNASDKAKHQNRTHKKTKDYHCPVMGCTKQYTDPSSLRKHVFNEHGEEVWHFAKQSKEEKGSKTYGVNLIGIRENGTPYFIPQAQMPMSSSDEDHEVDVMSTTPPPGGHTPRTIHASSHGEDRQQQQQGTVQWLEMNNEGRHGQTVTGPTEQQHGMDIRQPKQESVTSPAQNAGNGAVAEQQQQQSLLSNSTARLQQLKMDRGQAEFHNQQHPVQYVSETVTRGEQQKQQQQMFGFPQHHHQQQQQQQSNMPQLPMALPPSRPPVVHPMLSHKHEFPSPTHAPPSSVVHVLSHHQPPQFFGPSHNNSSNSTLNNGTSPPAIFDFQTQEFREFDFLNSPEDPMPSNESSGYGGDGGAAYGRMPMGGYHHHHQSHPHLHGGGGEHIAYAEGDGGCATAAAVHTHHRHYGYQQQCHCKECFVPCRPSPPMGRCVTTTTTTHPYPPPPPAPAVAEQTNAHYSMCTFDNRKVTSGCCQRSGAVQQQQKQHEQHGHHVYEQALSVQNQQQLQQQQHFGAVSGHEQQQHHLLVHHHEQEQQQQQHQYHQQHQMQAVQHHGDMIIRHESGGQIPHHGLSNERVVAPPGGPLSAGTLEDIELDEVSSTLSDLKMSGGGTSR